MAFSFLVSGSANSVEPPGNLRARFFYSADEKPEKFASLCLEETSNEEGSGREGSTVALVAAEVAATLAGKAAGALIDLAAVKAQPKATVLDVTIPVDGLFSYAKDAANVHTAISEGCLIVHNGTLDDPSSGTIVGVFKVKTSQEGNYFRFNVLNWKFGSFINREAGGFFSKGDKRDFAIKIEFLTPGTQGLGNRAVFFEKLVSSKTQSELADLFQKNEQLPWLALPPRPALPVGGNTLDYLSPFNLSISVIETTIPNILAVWLTDYAKANKDKVTNFVTDATRKALDADYAASEKSKVASTADLAYSAYKAAWDIAVALKEKKPEAAATPTPIQSLKFQGDLTEWNAKMVTARRIVSEKQSLAKQAFADAGISWISDLPEVPVN